MRITDHIHMLHMPFSIPIAPGMTVERSVNLFLIEGGAGWCLVDAGVAGSENAIFEYLKSLGHTPDRIRLLVLTHAHPDHVGAAKAVRDTAGCAVAAHFGDRRWIEDTELQERERPVPGFRALVAGSVKVDRVLADGEAIDLGGLTAEVIHTPGHSHGSISLYIREDRALITGDAVPVPGEPPIYEDAAASRRSVRRLKAVYIVETLLSSWDGPRRGAEVGRTLSESLAWMERVGDTVRRVANGGNGPESPEFGGRVLAELGIPPQSINPLSIMTFNAEYNAAQQDGAL